MNKVLYEYGVKILDKKIIEKRYILQYNDESFINSITELNEENTKSIFEKELHNIIDRLNIPSGYKEELKILQTEIIVRNKTKDDNYYFNWHFDDKKLIVHKKHNKNDLHDLEIIYEDEKNIYGLFNKNNNNKKKLVYTLIFYTSLWNIDFIGGEFSFVDKIIKPQKGMILLFHCDELHKVNLLNNGKRKAIVVKFYDFKEI
jgi:hypothetical protein